MTIIKNFCLFFTVLLLFCCQLSKKQTVVVKEYKQLYSYTKYPYILDFLERKYRTNLENTRMELDTNQDILDQITAGGDSFRIAGSNQYKGDDVIILEQKGSESGSFHVFRHDKHLISVNDKEELSISKPPFSNDDSHLYEYTFKTREEGYTRYWFGLLSLDENRADNSLVMITNEVAPYDKLPEYRLKDYEDGEFRLHIDVEKKDLDGDGLMELVCKDNFSLYNKPGPEGVLITNFYTFGYTLKWDKKLKKYK